MGDRPVTRTAVVVFPGSNCDRDAQRALQIAGAHSDLVWHTETDLDAYDVVVLPGGFSYGDYLRCGAIARTSPIMPAIRRAADRGALVLGICNGFQVLTEAGLLPGALVRNAERRFVCRMTELIVANDDTPFTSKWNTGGIVRMPVAHGEGCFQCDDETLAMIEAEGRVALRYAAHDNFNGSRHRIAGVTNRYGNVLGMMPHPERAVEPWMDSTDGASLVGAMLQAAADLTEDSMTVVRPGVRDVVFA
jgi:phosphoribosylformylglycinamidine synthase